jgi:predicted ester cyclase
MAATIATKAQAASVEANIALVRRFYEEVVNQQQSANFSEILSPDFIDHIPNPLPGQPYSGVRAMQWFIDTARTAIPDLQVTIEDIMAAGDKVVVRVTWRGTQRGPLLGADPTGEKVKFTGIDIIRIDEGKIAEHWGEVDVLAVISQLGFMPI